MSIKDSQTSKNRRADYERAQAYREGRLIPNVKLSKVEACRILDLPITTYDYYDRITKKEGGEAAGTA